MSNKPEALLKARIVDETDVSCTYLYIDSFSLACFSNTEERRVRRFLLLFAFFHIYQRDLAVSSVAFADVARVQEWDL